MAPGVPLGHKLVLLIIEVLVSRTPPPVGGKGTSLEHLSQSPLGSSNKMSLVQPILPWSAWGVRDICTLDLFFILFCFFPHWTRLWGSGVGISGKGEHEQDSQETLWDVDCITQRCLWVNKKLLLKPSHRNAPEWGDSDKAVKPSGKLVELVSLFSSRTLYEL